MKKEVFDKMLNSGEFEQMFNENKINDLLNDGSLSKEQIDKLVDLGKRMSKDEILRRQRDLAKQPGYKEHVLTPLIKKIIAQQGRARDPITGKYIKQEVTNQQKTEEQPQGQPQADTPNAEKTAEKAGQMGQKFKPKRMKNMFSGSRGATAKPATSKVNTELYSKIGQVQNPRLLKGDNAATVASKLYSIMKNDINEYNVRSKLERKRDNQYLDNERIRHNQIIAALNKAGGGPGGPSTTTAKTGMGMGTKLAVGAGLLGAAGLAAAGQKPTPEVLPSEPKIEPVVPKVETPPATPVQPTVNVEAETRKKQLEAERETAAQQEKQKREQESQARQAEQDRKAAEQKQAAEDKAAKIEADKKAAAQQKAAADEEARKQKEQQEEDKRKAAEAKAKTEREEKERKALADEEKRKKDEAERIAKAEADNERREAERLRREEEKTAREEAARIKKEREDAEKEADAQRKETALQRKKQAEAIAAEIERQRAQKEDYQQPRNGPRELPFDESIGRRYPTPIVRPTPAPPVVTPVPRPNPPRTLTPVEEPEPAPPVVTPVPRPAPPRASVTRVPGRGLSLTNAMKKTFKNEQRVTTLEEALDAAGNITEDVTGIYNYGVFGLINKKNEQGISNIGEFVKKNPQLNLPDPDKDSKKFNTEWKKLGKENPEKLLEAQLNRFNEVYVSAAVGILKQSNLPKNIIDDPLVQDYLTDQVVVGQAGLKEALKYIEKQNVKTPGEFALALTDWNLVNTNKIFPSVYKSESQRKKWEAGIKKRITNRLEQNFPDINYNRTEMEKLKRKGPIVIINNGTTVVGSTNRSGLSIPTSPDNSAYYPYAA